MSNRRRTADLSVEDLPLPSRGWNDRTRDFAETFDGYEYVGGGPEVLERRLIQPLYDALDRTGRVPHAYSIDDLRAVLYWLTRYDRHAEWTLGVNFPEFRLYVAVLDRIRYLLLKRAAAPKSTPAGRKYRCTWCGSRDVARIIYGMPAYDADMAANLESGQWALGGCMVWPGQGELHCNTCGHEYRRDGEVLAPPDDE